jgi:ADP-ribose pyrophosphatase YjhB (NUDIX family)
MAQIIWGERAARAGRLTIGCAAVIFSADRTAVLLTRRQDNGRWCLPGGHMEAGERADEACAREVREETGLEVRVGKLVGVYANPDRLVVYADGNKYHIVGLCFEAEPVGGALGLSDETTEVGYFTPAQIAALDLMEHHRERIDDAFAQQERAFVR